MRPATAMEPSAKQKRVHDERRRLLLDALTAARCAYPQAIWVPLTGSRWPNKGWRRALASLVAEGLVRVTGTGPRSTVYRLAGVAGMAQPQQGARKPSGPKPGLQDAAWLAALAEGEERGMPISVPGACTLWGVDRHVARARLLALTERGAIERVGDGTWRFCSKGKGRVAA